MRKKLTAILLAGAMCATLMTGCGGVDKNAVAATMNGAEVSMGVANFYCRYRQAWLEDGYKMYFGSNVWDLDLYGIGSTMEDTIKEAVMDSLHNMYSMKAHMDDYSVEVTEEDKKAIQDAAAAFMSDNSKAAIKELGATQGIVEEFLTLITIQNKIEAAIEAETDTNVPDEEANMRGYTQLKIATDTHVDDAGNSVSYTEEEAADLKTTAETILEELKEDGATLEDVAESHDYTTTKNTYATYESGEDDEEEEDPVVTALKALKEGETSGIIETDNALYIVRVDSDTDEEATEKNRESIIENRKNAHYTEVLENWQKDDGWEINQKQYAKIQFENSLTTEAGNSTQE